MDLKAKVCVACRGDEPTLTKSEIEEYKQEVDPAWKLESDPDKIVRDLEFANFKEAVSFVNKVAELAESEGHHPNIYIHSYKKVKIELWTHKIAGLHENDFIMAAKVDDLV